jgi:hypothetical protein
MADPADHPAAQASDDEEEADFAVTVPDDPATSAEHSAADEAPPLALLPTIGHVGRYALKQPLGSGGLGTVHAALDPLLGRAIAVKTLHLDPQAVQGQPLDALLLHEARAAAGLSHPYIVTVYDAGLAPEGVYIAMERLQGRDLRHLLAEGWRPTPQDAALIVRRVADALAYAHSKGVIHCDIKPANIFMIGRVQPKVLDFGIARVAQAGDTPARQALGGGSPYYMAPEQLRGEAVDVRCDVYALGAVLYELLAGRRPYSGQTLDEIRDAVLGAPLPALDAAVPPALAAVAERALARDPAQRYQTARQVSRALRAALDAHATSSQDAAAGALRKGRWLLPLAGSATALAALLVVAGWPGDETPPPVQTAAAPAAARVVPLPAVVDERAADATAPVARPTPTPPAAPAKRPPRETRTRAGATESAGTAQDSAAAATGVLQLAVSPWGEVEVNGNSAGTTPPLARLTLPVGTHTVVIRNDDFPAYRTTVTVASDRAATVRHRFGS